MSELKNKDDCCADDCCEKDVQPNDCCEANCCPEEPKKAASCC
ncbi:hypothetical protein [Paenibacillus antri]|nr:hypothetical protein [Paenibacillus antri]